MAPLPGRPARLVPVLHRPGGVGGVDPQLRHSVRARPAADRGLRRSRSSSSAPTHRTRPTGCVYLRKERQRRFASGGLRLWAVIDEVALRRPVGSAALMRAQLEHLLDISVRPGLTIQVSPFLTGASYAAPGSFSILSFATDDLPDVVYVEQLTSAMYLDKRGRRRPVRRGDGSDLRVQHDAGADHRSHPLDARGHGGIPVSSHCQRRSRAREHRRALDQEQLQRADGGNCVEIAFLADGAVADAQLSRTRTARRWSSPRPSGTPSWAARGTASSACRPELAAILSRAGRVCLCSPG